MAQDCRDAVRGHACSGLVDAARLQYENDGFYISPEAVVPDEIVANALAGMEAVVHGEYDTGVPPSNQPEYDAGKLCKINDAHRASQGIRDLICHPAIGEWVAGLTGARRVQVWASQLLIKPSGVSQAGNVGWHQDRQYWQYWEEGSELLTAWIALHDIGADAGPMGFVRGSHRWGFLGQGDFFATDQEQLREEIRVPEGESWEEVSALLPAGGASFHHCLTYHGSGANTSGVPRRSFAFHLCTERPRAVEGATDYYVSHLDDPGYCPIIYGE